MKRYAWSPNSLKLHNSGMQDPKLEIAGVKPILVEDALAFVAMQESVQLSSDWSLSTPHIEPFEDSGPYNTYI